MREFILPQCKLEIRLSKMALLTSFNILQCSSFAVFSGSGEEHRDLDRAGMGVVTDDRSTGESMLLVVNVSHSELENDESSDGRLREYEAIARLP